ncbi:hypothetical protein PSEHALCIP103_02436 [Pseudoalteromonas haloplanktis]|uniref:Uncharacterized protein n=2 Tax=Pseudoalteromonas haloplanktis TaxID=228 RepID=A0A9W4VSG3_PSEHA|nr:hypothetical protein PSEHALCIP103_02436 [Pseudoalteromonas haloplanktis]
MQSVMPQNWLFLKDYRHQRASLLTNQKLVQLIRLGSGAFDTISGENVKAILVGFDNNIPTESHSPWGIDISMFRGVCDKSNALTKELGVNLPQKSLYLNPMHVIALEDLTSDSYLAEYAESFAGVCTGDYPRFGRNYWEILNKGGVWEFQSSTVSVSKHWGGLSKVLLWENGQGSLYKFVSQRLGEKNVGSWLRGNTAWNRRGISVKLMTKLPVSAFGGNKFDDNVAVLQPKNEKHLLAIQCYCESEDFSKDVRKVNDKLAVKTQYLLQVPFNLNKWLKVAGEKYPKGFPLPYSNDPTQWIFHGHPCSSVVWDEETKTTSIGDLREDDTVLQVAVARLLGYRWPAELDEEMELAPEIREVFAQNKVFDGLVDDDGIVCIPAIRGEKPAVDRLEAILHAAYGDKWSATVLNNLLKSVKSRDLNIWLRDKFFEQHCKLFQHRPFIWHIWDGIPDGFSALVNYHQLDYKGLERLIYTYLDDWISTQIQLEKDGDEGAEIRLAASRNLRKQLEDILIGEKGLDIFVRWKSLAEQPIGWNPDLNDGVRLNIRPFMKAKDVGKKDAGILRSKPNIHWKKDRGTDVTSAPWFDLGLEYGGKQGDRINDHHLTLAEKKASRMNIND